MIEGAKTVIEQCLNVKEGESVLILNDSTDTDMIDALESVSEDITTTNVLVYPEPDNHGEEPPKRIREEMLNADVVVAPTKKSLSHTRARRQACEAGARVATLPGITKEIWKTSLTSDYEQVKEISEDVLERLQETETVQITTPSGTDITVDIDSSYFHTDTGIIHNPGDFGNLPAGEADGPSMNANGRLVIDRFPFAPSGTVIEIRDNAIVDVEEPHDERSELRKAIEGSDCVKHVAEFGFGTNPEATLIDNVLQDEKVLGTVHIAFGDNTSYVPERHKVHNECHIHWDAICESPTVTFDKEKMLIDGDPVFLE